MLAINGADDVHVPQYDTLVFNGRTGIHRPVHPEHWTLRGAQTYGSRQNDHQLARRPRSSMSIGVRRTGARALDRTCRWPERSRVVTGGSRGIGFAIARLFVTLGAQVLIVSRREELVGRPPFKASEAVPGTRHNRLLRRRGPTNKTPHAQP